MTTSAPRRRPAITTWQAPRAGMERPSATRQPAPARPRPAPPRKVAKGQQRPQQPRKVLPKAAATSKKPRARVVPPLRLPTTAEELELLAVEELGFVVRKASMKLGKLKRTRADLLAAGETDHPALNRVVGQMAQMGALVQAACQRRSELRAQARREMGEILELDVAVARACESVLPEPWMLKVQAVAQQILSKAERDLAKEK